MHQNVMLPMNVKGHMGPDATRMGRPRPTLISRQAIWTENAQRTRDLSVK